MMNFVLKMMNFVSEMMDFVFELMAFVFQNDEFCRKVRGLAKRAIGRQCLLRGICLHNRSHNLHLIVGLNCIYIFPGVGIRGSAHGHWTSLQCEGLPVCLRCSNNKR